MLKIEESLRKCFLNFKKLNKINHSSDNKEMLNKMSERSQIHYLFFRVHNIVGSLRKQLVRI